MLHIVQQIVQQGKVVGFVSAEAPSNLGGVRGFAAQPLGLARKPSRSHGHPSDVPKRKKRPAPRCKHPAQVAYAFHCAFAQCLRVGWTRSLWRCRGAEVISLGSLLPILDEHS